MQNTFAADSPPPLGYARAGEELKPDCCNWIDISCSLQLKASNTILNRPLSSSSLLWSKKQPKIDQSLDSRFPAESAVPLASESTNTAKAGTHMRFYPYALLRKHL